MPRTVVLFGSTSGNTERIAKDLARILEGGADVFPISTFQLDRLSTYDRIILGASTWGAGDLQDDWAATLPKLARQNLSGKVVAIFGLGDAEGYADTFVDGMGELHAAMAETGAHQIGFWSTEGYVFEGSKAVEGGQFVGLVLDEDNHPEKTVERLRHWADSLQVS